MEDSLGLDMAPLAPQPVGDVVMRDAAPGAAPGQPTPLAVAEISEADKLGLPVELESSSDGAPDTSALTAAGGVLVVHDGGAPAPPVVKARKMLSTQWTVEMDAQLTEAVAKFGEGHWSKIAELVEGRTGKQCRERWKNQISSEVKKGDWTVEEDALIVVCVNELGTKWSEISKRFVGRTDNAIKNRYNSEVRKRERAEQRVLREATAAEERAKNPQPENSAPPNPPRKRKSGGGGGGKRKKNEADLHDDIWFEADEAVTRLESREIDMLLSELNQDAGPLGLGGGGGGEGDEGEGGDGCDEEGHTLHQVLQSLRRARSPQALLDATKKVCSWEDRQKHRGKAKLRTPSSHPNAPGPLRMPGSHSQLAQLLHDDEHQLLHDDLLLYDEGTCTYDFSQLLSPEARGSCSLGGGLGALTAPLPGRSGAPRSAPSVQGARSLPASQLAGGTGARRSLPSSTSGRPSRPRSAGPTCLARALPTCGRSAPGSSCPTPQGRSLRGSKLPLPSTSVGAGVWGIGGVSGVGSPSLTSPTLLADLLASPPLSGSRSGSRRASPRLAAVPLVAPNPPTHDLLASAAAAADAADAAGIGSSGGSSRPASHSLKRPRGASPLAEVVCPDGGGPPTGDVEPPPVSTVTGLLAGLVGGEGAPSMGGASCSSAVERLRREGERKEGEVLRLCELPFYDLAALLTPLIASSIGAPVASVRSFLRLGDLPGLKPVTPKAPSSVPSRPTPQSTPQPPASGQSGQSGEQRALTLTFLTLTLLTLTLLTLTLQTLTLLTPTLALTFQTLTLTLTPTLTLTLTLTLLRRAALRRVATPLAARTRSPGGGRRRLHPHGPSQGRSFLGPPPAHAAAGGVSPGRAFSLSRRHGPRGGRAHTDVLSFACGRLLSILSHTDVLSIQRSIGCVGMCAVIEPGVDC